MGKKDIGSYSFEDTKKYVEDCGYVFYDMMYREYGKNKDKRMCINVSCGEHEPYWVILNRFKKGNRCRECHFKIQVKWNEQTIKEYIESADYKFLSIIGKENGNKSRVLIMCNKGHEYNITFSNFYSGDRCPYCYGNIKHDYKYIKNEIENSGEYELLSDNYMNNSTGLKVRCLKHDHIYKITWASWQNGSRCKLCANDKLSKERRHNIEYVREQVERDNKFILLSDQYINNTTSLKIKCNNCNNVFDDNYANFNNRRNCPYCMSVNWDLYKQEVLLGMIRYYKECFGKVPNQSDIDKANYLPSASVYYRIFDIKDNDWNKVLALSGLKYKKINIFYTDEFFRNEFFRWIEQHDGRIPKREDMKHRDGYPNANDYCTFYNISDRQWQPILDIMDVERKYSRTRLQQTYSYLDESYIIEMLKEILNKQGNINRDTVAKFVSPYHILKSLRVNKWADVTAKCGLKATKERIYNKDAVLRQLKQRIIKLGYTPTGCQYSSLGYLPSIQWFNTHFGSYESAINEIGYKTFRGMNNEDLKELLINYSKSLGKCPTITEMGNKNHMPSVGMYYERFNVKNWSEVLDTCGIEHDIKDKYSKEYLIDKLVEFKNYLNRLPTKQDFKDWSWIPSEKPYYDNFGTMDDAFLEAGLISEILTDEKRVEYSIQAIKDYYLENNIIPTVEKYNTVSGKGFDRRTLETKMKMKYSDIIYYALKDSINNENIGRHGYDKNGNLCRSLPEFDISNYLIDNFNLVEKEVLYTEIFKNELNSPRKFDWKVYAGNIEYYVEYFGMYERNPKWHVTEKYSNRTKKKIKDLYKAETTDKCIFIFPNDLKNKTLDEIFSKYIDLDKVKQLNVS